jgi:hypothetical protein
VKTTLAALGLVAFCLAASFFAFFPKVAVAPVCYVSQKFSDWRMAQRTKAYEESYTGVKNSREIVDIYIAIPCEVSASAYDADHAYRDAAYNLAAQVKAGFTPDTVWMLSRGEQYFDSVAADIKARVDAILEDSTALKEAARAVGESNP